MKNYSILLSIIFFASTPVMAQSNDAVPVRPVVEKGTKGDLVLGKENKMKQLNTSPQLLQQGDSVEKKTRYLPLKKKKYKHKKI